jgi:hypothetical protein
MNWTTLEPARGTVVATLKFAIRDSCKGTHYSKRLTLSISTELARKWKVKMGDRAVMQLADDGKHCSLLLAQNARAAKTIRGKSCGDSLVWECSCSGPVHEAWGNATTPMTALELVDISTDRITFLLPEKLQPDTKKPLRTPRP